MPPLEQRSNEGDAEPSSDRDPQPAGVFRRQEDPDAGQSLADQPAFDVLLDGEEDDAGDHEPWRDSHERSQQRPRLELPGRSIAVRITPSKQQPEVAEPEGSEDGKAHAEHEAGRDGGAPRVAMAGMDQLLAVARSVSGEVHQLVGEDERNQLKGSCRNQARKSPKHAAHSRPCPLSGRSLERILSTMTRTQWAIVLGLYASFAALVFVFVGGPGIPPCFGTVPTGQVTPACYAAWQVSLANRPIFQQLFDTPWGPVALFLALAVGTWIVVRVGARSNVAESEANR